MPSKQAMETAVEIVNGDGKWESDPKEVKRAAKIIDAAFADVIAESDQLKTIVESLQNHMAGKSRPAREILAELRAEQ